MHGRIDFANCLYIVVCSTSLGGGIQPSLMVDIKENCFSSDCLFGAVYCSLDISGREECALSCLLLSLILVVF